jgi:tight adherence protein B
MGYLIALAFASGFLLIFGMNLLYSELVFEREKARREQLRQDSRSLQVERARLAVQHRDLYEIAATSTDQSARRPFFERLELYIEQSGLPRRKVQFTTIVVLLASLLAILLGISTRYYAFGFTAAGFCIVLPCLYLARVRRRRIEKLLSQLPNAFDLISRMMRAGQTFSQAMHVTGDESDAPLADEFGYCSDQQRLGLSTDAALRDLARRTGVLEIRIFVLAVVVHRQTGGNLSVLLENLSQIIRDRYRVRGIIEALTAEGRMQAYILLALPIVMLIMLTALNPEYMRELYTRPYLLFGTGLAMFLGALWMRRIVQFRY